MTPELIVTIITATLTFIVGILTIITNVQMNKLKNLETTRKYNKNITNYELQFKDEKWFREIMESGEFSNYNEKSQTRIYYWWQEYEKTHKVNHMRPTVDITKLKERIPIRPVVLKVTEEEPTSLENGPVVNWIIDTEDEEPKDLF